MKILKNSLRSFYLFLCMLNFMIVSTIVCSNQDGMLSESQAYATLHGCGHQNNKADYGAKAPLHNVADSFTTESEKRMVLQLLRSAGADVDGQDSCDQIISQRGTCYKKLIAEGFVVPQKRLSKSMSFEQLSKFSSDANSSRETAKSTTNSPKNSSKIRTFFWGKRATAVVTPVSWPSTSPFSLIDESQDVVDQSDRVTSLSPQNGSSMTHKVLSKIVIDKQSEKVADEHLVSPEARRSLKLSTYKS